MRAATLEAAGEPVFGSFRSPKAETGRKIVDVDVAGLNPIDLILAKQASSFPLVPGREGVGKIDGRRVYFTSVGAPFGSLAEQSLADPARVFSVPDDISSDTAVTLGIVGLTAWLSLSWSACMTPGEHVLVLGASGAVGSVAVQAARLLGAGRVIAASRSEDGLRRAKTLGADETVSLSSIDGLADRFRAAGEGRIDVIVDTLWGEPAIAALRAAAPRARLVQIGSSAASEISFSPVGMRMPLTSILGFSGGSIPHEERSKAYADLCDHISRREIDIDIETIPLEQIASAWARQAAFPRKKLVIKI